MLQSLFDHSYLITDKLESVIKVAHSTLNLLNFVKSLFSKQAEAVAAQDVHCLEEPCLLEVTLTVVIVK